MASITIDKNKLEHYNEKVSKAKFAILFKSLSNDQKETLNKLVAFLKEYLGNAKYQKQSIDAQNFYFSKRHVENIIEIFKDNASISDKTISTYISTALKDSALDDFMFSKSDVQTLEKKIKNALQSILDKVVDDKKDTETPEKEKSQTIVAGEISKYVKENIYIPKLNLGKTVLGFLNKNVFLNLANAINSKKFEFAGPDKISKNLFKKRFTFFTKIWNPTVADIKRPFRRFEIQVTRGFVYKAKKQVRRFAKNVTGFFNLLFPVVILAKVLKYGIGFVKFGVKAITKSIKFVYKTVSKAISFAVSSVKFVVRTAIRTGVGAIKLLTKTLKKVGALKLIKLSSRLLLGFFRTHAGAYLLGFIVGTIVRKLSGILDLLKSIKDGALTIFGNVSNFINEHIMPYLDPILTGIKNLIDAISFYGDEIYKSFNDEKENGLVAQLDSIVTNLMPTHPDFNPDVIGMKLERYQIWIEEVFSSANLKGIIIDGALRFGGAMLGSLVGAHLGSALGNVIFPGIGGIAGGIIGSMLGGMGGEWLGKQLGDLIKENAGFTEVQSSESRLQKYLRQTVGARNLYEFEKYGSAGNAAFSALRNLGNIAYEETDLLNSPQVKQLQRYGFNIRGYISNSTVSNEQKRQTLSQLNNIGNLSYYNVLAEINETFSEITNILNSHNSLDKGIMWVGDVKNKKFITNLYLGNDQKLDLNRFIGTEHNGAPFNPYWYKISRAIAINNLVSNLLFRKIDPINFIDTFNSFSDPSKLIKYLNTNKLKIHIDNIAFNPEDRIYRRFDSDELKMVDAYMEKYNPDFFYMMQWKKEWDEAVANGDNEMARYAKGEYERYKANYEYYLKENNFDKTQILEYIPLTNSLFAKLKTINVKKLLTSTENEFKFRFLNQGTSQNSIFDSLISELSSKYDTSLISKQNLEYRLQQYSNEIEIMSDIEFKDFLRKLIINDIETSGQGTPELARMALEAQIGSRLRLPESNGKTLSEMTSDELKKAFEGADGNNMEIAALIATYKEMTGEDSDFLRERILPFVENLIKQGANAQTIYGIFGIPYSSDNRLPTADTAGEMADPSAGL